MTRVAAAERLVVAAAERRDAVVHVIDSAREHLSLSLFRCDDEAVLDAIGRASHRGVHVRALVTARARASKVHLKQLRKRLTSIGVDVRRYSDPVVRYHAKYAIADTGSAIVASLNFTRKCFTDTCDFLVLLSDPEIVGELLRLFDADWHGRRYSPSGDAGNRLIVGPEHARRRFTDLLRQARHSIRLIDPKISDPAMRLLLRTRAADGVTVDIREHDGLGSLIPHGKLLMIDNALAVTGSIALSTMTLEFRRELAVLTRDTASLGLLEQFWASLPPLRSAEPSTSLSTQEPVS